MLYKYYINNIYKNINIYMYKILKRIGNYGSRLWMFYNICVQLCNNQLKLFK